MSEFRCKKCASNFGTHRQLTAHKAALHTGSFNSTGGSDAMSISEKLMIEDMSMTDISTIDTVEITPLDGSFFKCESCDFKTKFGNELWDHEGSDHREKVSESIPASVPKKSEELNVNIIDSEVIGKKEETAGRHRVEDVAADETEKINTGDENDKAAPEDEVIIEEVQEINAKGNTQDENDKAATAVSKDKVIIKEVQDLNAKGNSGDENDKAVTAGSKGEVIIEEVQELTTKVNVLPTEKITTLNGQREGNSASHTEIGEKQTKAQKVELEVENTTCIFCGEDSIDSDRLKEHIANLHGEKNKHQTPSLFPCEKCNYISKTKIGLDRHIEYFCKKCNVCLAEMMEVDIHSNLHGECISKNCGFISTGTTNLGDHVKSQHPKEHFPCTKCETVLKTQTDLFSHFNSTHRNTTKEKETGVMQTQTEEVLNLCEQCEFGFSPISV